MKRFKLFSVCIFAILVMIACQPDYNGIMEDPNNPYLPGNRTIDSYEKLVSAINAAADGATIHMDDIVVDPNTASTIEISKNISLTGSITLADSAVNSRAARAVNTPFVLFTVTSGTLNISSASITVSEGVVNNVKAVVSVDEEGVVNVGTITANGAVAIELGETATSASIEGTLTGLNVSVDPNNTAKGEIISSLEESGATAAETFTWDVTARLAKHSRGASEDHDNWKEVESVSYSDGTITIVANVDGLDSYPSSSSQGDGQWIAILVGTGDDTLTNVAYEGTPLTDADIADRNDMRGTDDTAAAGDEFVIWYKAEELLANGATFTLSHAGASDFTVNVVLNDGYNVLSDTDELIAAMNGGKGKYQLGDDIVLTSQLVITPSAALELDGGTSYTISRDKNNWGTDAQSENGIILVDADYPVTLSNLKVVKTGGFWDPSSTGEAEWHTGEYGIKIFDSSEVTLQNIAVTDCNAGILVSSSSVTADGEIAVGGNAFGGIEVSVGSAGGNSSLTFASSAVITCGDETVPAVWIDGAAAGTSSVSDGTNSLTAYTNSEKDDQIWYLASDQSVDTFEGTLTPYPAN